MAVNPAARLSALALVAWLFSAFLFVKAPVLAADLGPIGDAINAARQQQGSAALAFDTRLVPVAESRLSTLLERQSADHRSGDDDLLREALDNAGLVNVRGGEVIATGLTDPPSIANAWLGSPNHRRIVLDPQFRQIAFASGTFNNGTVPVTLAILSDDGVRAAAGGRWPWLLGLGLLIIVGGGLYRRWQARPFHQLQP